MTRGRDTISLLTRKRTLRSSCNNRASGGSASHARLMSFRLPRAGASAFRNPNYHLPSDTIDEGVVINAAVASRSHPSLIAGHPATLHGGRSGRDRGRAPCRSRTPGTVQSPNDQVPFGGGAIGDRPFGPTTRGRSRSAAAAAGALTSRTICVRARTRTLYIDARGRTYWCARLIPPCRGISGSAPWGRTGRTARCSPRHRATSAAPGGRCGKLAPRNTNTGMGQATLTAPRRQARRPWQRPDGRGRGRMAVSGSPCQRSPAAPRGRGGQKVHK